MVLYALVYWIKTNEASVLTEDFVTDKEQLKNPKKIGMVVFGEMGKKPPKDGWKSYKARVIAVSESKKEIYKKEKEFLQDLNDKSIETIEYSASECDIPNKKKDFLKRQAERADMNSILETMTKQKKIIHRSTPADDSENSDLEQSVDGSETLAGHSKSYLISKIKDLEKTIEEIKTKKRRLQELNFVLQDRIPKVITEAIKLNLVSSAINSSTKLDTTNNLKNTPRPGQNNQDIGMSSASSPTIESPELDPLKYLTRSEINEVFRTKDFKKMTCCFMTAIFTVKEMNSSLVTGKRIKREDANRPLLNQEKVQFIVDNVCDRFKDVSPSQVRARMAQKCKDMRNSNKARVTDTIDSDE